MSPRVLGDHPAQFGPTITLHLMNRDRLLGEKCETSVRRRGKLEPRNSKEVDELAAHGAMSVYAGDPRRAGMILSVSSSAGVSFSFHWDIWALGNELQDLYPGEIN